MFCASLSGRAASLILPTLEEKARCHFIHPATRRHRRSDVVFPFLAYTTHQRAVAAGGLCLATRLDAIGARSRVATRYEFRPTCCAPRGSLVAHQSPATARPRQCGLRNPDPPSATRRPG